MGNTTVHNPLHDQHKVVTPCDPPGPARRARHMAMPSTWKLERDNRFHLCFHASNISVMTVACSAPGPNLSKRAMHRPAKWAARKIIAHLSVYRIEKMEVVLAAVTKIVT